MTGLLPPATETTPKKTCELADQFAERSPGERLSKLPPAPRYPARPIALLVRAIERGQGAGISMMEWVLFLRDKPQWDEENSLRAKEIARKTWRVALRQSGLWEMFIWRWGLQMLGYADLFPESMIQTARAIVGEIPSTEQRRWQILHALEQGGAQGLALTAMRNRAVPIELLARVRLPTWGPILDEALGLCPLIYTQRNSRDARWLLSCISAMAPRPQMGALEHLLETIPAAAAATTHAPLVNWLIDEYGPAQANSRWERLSQQGRRALREWTGAAYYRDFDHLVSLLCTSRRQAELGMYAHTAVLRLRAKVKSLR